MNPTAPSATMPQSFHAVMRHFPTAVTVVTTATADRSAGMTASSVTSLSLDPGLLLICVRRSGLFGGLLAESDGFTVNVLQDRQAELAQWFADPERYAVADEFAGVGWRPSRVSGRPVLEGAACVLECRTTELMPGGDHLIVIGQVVACAADPAGQPLLRYQGGYHAVGGALRTATRARGSG
jgi:flavin reductase (DIM6/NTAB) family NADH-FMN oxidoreductase RutF